MQFNKKYILKLTVNDHPGVMSHVCGLFSRRGYNLEGIIVRPVSNESMNHSLMWLLLADQGNAEQIMAQTTKLIDVKAVERYPVTDGIFEKLDNLIADNMSIYCQ